MKLRLNNSSINTSLKAPIQQGFALWDAYNIYAEKNGLKIIEASVSYKQATTIVCNPCVEESYSTIDDIVKFCHEHPNYQNHSYLDDEASAPEIAKLMHKYSPCADLVGELNAKYKNIMFSSTIEDAIDIYQAMALGAEDIISSEIS